MVKDYWIKFRTENNARPLIVKKSSIDSVAPKSNGSAIINVCGIEYHLLQTYEDVLKKLGLESYVTSV